MTQSCAANRAWHAGCQWGSRQAFRFRSSATPLLLHQGQPDWKFSRTRARAQIRASAYSSSRLLFSLCGLRRGLGSGLGLESRLQDSRSAGSERILVPRPRREAWACGDRPNRRTELTPLRAVAGGMSRPTRTGPCCHETWKWHATSVVLTFVMRA